MAKSTVYIDESGDLGYGTGTKWFVITAVVVEREKESSIRQKMDVIKRRLNVQEIHLRRIADFYRRSYVANELNGEDFTYMNVIADTNKLDREKIASPALAYNYMCRVLLERVSWFLRDLKMNAWGFRIPCHFNVLKGHLYKYKGNVMRYGIKYFSDEMIPIKGEIEQNFPCKIKERTPGATTT